jgi:O-antigen/teichoic acid export membrane protein
LNGIVLGLVITQYFNAVLAVISIRSLLYGEFTYKHSITKLIKQSFPFYLESYLMYFRSQGDNWLVSTTLGATSLGLYYISKTIFSTLSVIYTSTDRVLTAQLANYKHEHQLFLENLNKIHLALSQFSVPFIFVCICFIPLAVQVLGGADYAQSITPAAILLLVLLVQLLRIPIGRTIFILKSSTNRLYITIVDTVSLLMLLFILTPLYGIVGVALARFISQTIGFVFAAWLFKKLMGFTLETKNILVSLLVCAPLLIFFIIEKTNSKMTEYLLGFGFTLFLWLTLITAILYFFNNKLFRKVKRATIDKLIFNK